MGVSLRAYLGQALSVEAADVIMKRYTSCVGDAERLSLLCNMYGLLIEVSGITDRDYRAFLQKLVEANVQRGSSPMLIEDCGTF